MRIGRVREIWRYPVKSMCGERLAEVSLGSRGVHGDRLWAVRDEDKGALTNAKRIPSLLLLRARYASEPHPGVGPGAIPDVIITFPDRSEASSADADIHARLSVFLGRRVTLHPLRPASDTAFYERTTPAAELPSILALDEGEPMPDFSMMPADKLGELDIYASPPGTYFDAFNLHVVTTASLGDFDARRFRANVVVDSGDARGYLELDWSGGTLALGATTAFVDCPAPRCSMPTRAQADGVPADKTVLRAIARDADRCLGAYATVTTAGTLRTGDDVTLAPPETAQLGAWAKKRAAELQKRVRAAMSK